MKRARRMGLLALCAAIALTVGYATQHHGVLVLTNAAWASPETKSAKRVRSVTLVSCRWSPVRYWAGSSCGCTAADARVGTLKPFGAAALLVTEASEHPESGRSRSLVDVHFNAGDAFWTERVVLAWR